MSPLLPPFPPVETPVLVPIDEWLRLQSAARPTLKELLLAETPRAEIPVPSRHRWRRRTPEVLEFRPFTWPLE